MAKTSNRQETFNHKAHDQKKPRAAETRQTESSSPPHKHKKNIDIGTAKETKEENSGKMRILNKKLKEIP